MKFISRTNLFYFLLFIISTSCDQNVLKYKSKPQDEAEQGVNEWNEAYHSNLKPMYGNKTKSAEEKTVDKNYVDFMLEHYKGDTLKAAKKAADKGWYYFFHNIIDTAMFRFNQCWLIDSTYAESYFGFAAIKEYQGLKEADHFYQLAYKHDKTGTLTKKILNKIADIKEQQKDTLALLIAFQRAFYAIPNNGIASGKLDFFYSTVNKLDSALKYYNMTIKLDPEYEQTYLNRAWLFYREGKFDEAIADYTRIIEKNKNSIRGYSNRANILMDKKDYQLAIADIDCCINLDPNHPNFHFAKAECYHQLKQDKKACEEINAGIKKGGQYVGKLKEYKCE